LFDVKTVVQDVEVWRRNRTVYPAAPVTVFHCTVAVVDVAETADKPLGITHVSTFAVRSNTHPFAPRVYTVYVPVAKPSK
jgi:hypothetical protein